jgi:beta-lactamase class A
MKLVAAIACAVSALAFAQPTAPAPNPDLDRQVRAAIAGFPGKVTLYAKNIDTGERYGIGEDQPVRTASTIKLAILAAVFHEISEGRAQLDERIGLRDADKVSGSGVLAEFSDGDRLTISDLVRLMVVVSDNTATNLLLDRFTGDAVNAYMDALGFPKTRSLRKILGDGGKLKPEPSGLSAAGRVPANQRFGIGVSTPREMAGLIEKIARGEVAGADASRQMIEILKRQQYKDIGRRIGEETPVASKSGALDHLRSDVAVVYSKSGRIAIAITCEDIPTVDYSPDNPGELFIAKLGQLLIDGLRRR